MRHDGQLLDCAGLIALGVGPDERCALLGVSVTLSEAEVHWRAFSHARNNTAATEAWAGDVMAKRAPPGSSTTRDEAWAARTG